METEIQVKKEEQQVKTEETKETGFCSYVRSCSSQLLTKLAEPTSNQTLDETLETLETIDHYLSE